MDLPTKSQVELGAAAPDVLSAEERHLLLKGWNARSTVFPSDCSLAGLFEEQAGLCPDAVAIESGEERISYAELSAWSERVASDLRALGVSAGQIVGLSGERSASFIAGMVGILKTGAAYLPLDPHYPAERLSFMAKDAGVSAVLVADGGIGVEGIIALGVAPSDATGPTASVCPDIGGEAAAYVMYTSGSSGIPKGVVVPHRAVIRLVRDTDYASFGPKDRMAHIASPSFDPSTFEVWGALLNGGTLVVLSHETVLSPAALATALKAKRITAGAITTAVFHRLVQEDPEAVASYHTLLVGGEALDPAVMQAVLPHTPLHGVFNAYGPTEATVACICHRVERIDAGARSVPIGRPIANSPCYVLDRHLEPVPVGVAGELYLGGAGLALGYLNRAGLTSQRFVANPFGDGDRLYRTGDLVRYRADGNLEFLGRNDFQVKIRGYRIELGEIESRLTGHPDVREAVVIAREDIPGEKRLVAYVRAHEDAAPAALSLREYLSAQLPDYMVPGAFVVVEAFPLTANGKLDRKALPAPEAEAYARRGYAAPVGPVESTLAEIWAELLGIERVGRNDNFFELGGHSLAAVRLLERMRQQGYRMDVRAIFLTPTIAALAETVSGEPAGHELAVSPDWTGVTQSEIDTIAKTMPERSIQNIYPLSPLQKGMLFHHLKESEGDFYLYRTLLAFASRHDLDRFIEALQMVIQRHDALRTALRWEGLSEPVQVVHRHSRLPVIELMTPQGSQSRSYLLERSDPRHVRLDLRHPTPICVYAVFDADSGTWLVSLLMHHIVLDNFALQVLLSECGLILQGKADRLQPPVPYRNFIAQISAARQPEHEDFFRRALGGLAEPTIPFGVARVESLAETLNESRMPIPAELASRIRRVARREGVSPAVLYHMAWAIMLQVCTNSDDVVFGSVLSGRLQGMSGTDRTVGMCINTLPVRVRLTAGVRDGVKETSRYLAELLEHEHAPLVLAQRCSAVAATGPLFSTMLNYRHSQLRGTAGDEIAGSEIDGVRLLGVEERSHYPITGWVNDFGEGFEIGVQGAAAIDAVQVRTWFGTAAEMLTDALEREPDRSLASFALLSAGEHHRIVEEWNDTDRAYPSHTLIHEMFEDQAVRVPDALAVVHKDRRLTYAELNARANRVAHHLIGLGVRPDDRVALYVERGIEMVVGLLGILKSGGAYVPLDPAYPADRIACMLEDSAPKVVLTAASLHAGVQSWGTAILCLDGDDCVRAEPESNPNIGGLNASHLAYVIYTSGSTGLPKGVMVEHRNLVSSIWSRLAQYPGSQHSVLITSHSFDSSVASIFGSLCSGGSLVLAPSPEPGCVGGLVREHEVNTLLCTPSYARILLEGTMPEELRSVRDFIFAGEQCSSDLVKAATERFPAISFHNEYGPTEATIWATHSQIDAGRPVVPIGRPISNTQIYILDGHRRPVPTGVAGELYIGGAGLARGYLRRPSQTAEQFIANPFGDGDRLYRTGDLARHLGDGTIEYLGRNDFQVKIRGFRIELGEIESRLREHSGIREAVVLARDVAGEKRLVAYYVPARDIETEALRVHLSESLPDYMVPGVFVQVDTFPLTPNGKLDRNALPAPDATVYARRDYAAPVGSVESTLSDIWAELLEIENVGRYDNFFELGGNSLLAMGMVIRAEGRLGMKIPLPVFLEAPTIESLAAKAERKEAA